MGKLPTWSGKMEKPLRSQSFSQTDHQLISQQTENQVRVFRSKQAI